MAVPVLKADIKASVKADVTKPVDKLIDAVVEAFSPATETLGFLGDAVRLARVEVAAAITRRAKEIADESGLTLTAPPLKFLVPFYEKASIEDQDSQNLSEMWARLLVSAGTKYNGYQVKFVSLLSEMNSEQAKFLQELVSGSGRDESSALSHGVLYRMNLDAIENVIKNIDERDLEATEHALYNVFQQTGTALETIYILMNEKSSGRGGVAEFDLPFRFNLINAQILRSYGILELRETGLISAKRANIKVSYYYLSELGVEFYKACGSGARNTGSPKAKRRSPGKRRAHSN